MATLKQFAALLMAVAALLTSVLALSATQKRAEAQKASAEAVTKAVVAAQQEEKLESTLDTNTCEAELLGIKALNTEVGSFDASISTAGPLQAIESKLNQAEEKDDKKEEDQKDGQTSQDSSASSSANKYADDYDYADFCGRLYIPVAGIDVALYNNTWQETCNRSDSAAIFPHRPEDGGSNIVADNELETLTSVSVGSTAYVITPSGQQINYVCVDAFDGHNDVTGYDALQKDDGTIVWGSAELIVYTCLGDSYNVRVACFSRA
mgnify:FL=1